MQSPEFNEQRTGVDLADCVHELSEALASSGQVTNCTELEL